jgi:hypothetical protein
MKRIERRDSGSHFIPWRTTQIDTSQKRDMKRSSLIFEDCTYLTDDGVCSIEHATLRKVRTIPKSISAEPSSESSDADSQPDLHGAETLWVDSSRHHQW